MNSPRLVAAQQTLAHADWQAAARQLRRAAADAAARGEAQRAAHCEQMAASLYRAAGSLDDSLAAAARSAARDSGSPRTRFAAEAERAETLFAAGEFAGAARSWSAALKEADTFGLPDVPRATVLRRRALCLAQAGEAAAAWAVFDEAAVRMAGADIAHASAWVDVEHAQAACEAGDASHAGQVLARERVVRAAADDLHLRAQRHCVSAACALACGDAASARTEALAAREAALAAVAPLAYFAAAVSLARAADTLGDRAEAYRSLASAWVTLADLLGPEVGRSWVEPVLAAFQWQWGAEAFAAVRAAHERARRAQLDGGAAGCCPARDAGR